MLKLQFDCACFQKGEVRANFDGKVEEEEEKNKKEKRKNVW